MNWRTPRAGRSPGGAGPSDLRWHRAVATALALLIAMFWLWTWSMQLTAPYSTDFLSYWAAGRLTAEGDPAAAYDIARHRAVELGVTQFGGLLTFPYPPPFLLVLMPFGLAPYHWALAGWVIATATLYLVAVRRIVPIPYAFSHPSVLLNAWIGQIAFLTSGIFIAGTAMVRRRPFVAGAILGTLIIKPHLALLLPVAVIASRQWTAIAGAALSSLALLLLALVLLGAETYAGFFAMLSVYAEMMTTSKWPWTELISPFAFARSLGVDQTAALVIHVMVALSAAVLTWKAWSGEWDEKVPILAAATLLIPPYLFTYDGLLLVVPLAFWVTAQKRPLLVPVVWLLCALPIARFLFGYAGPNTIPVAAIVALGALAAGRRSAGGHPAHVNHADVV